MTAAGRPAPSDETLPWAPQPRRRTAGNTLDLVATVAGVLALVAVVALLAVTTLLWGLAPECRDACSATADAALRRGMLLSWLGLGLALVGGVSLTLVGAVRGWRPRCAWPYGALALAIVAFVVGHGVSGVRDIGGV